MGRRRDMALILILLYSSMAASALPQLFNTTGYDGQETDDVENYGKRSDIIRNLSTRYNITKMSHRGRSVSKRMIPIYAAGSSARRRGRARYNVGNRHGHYLGFIVAGVSASIAYLCRVI